MQDLGTLGGNYSAASAINDNGQIVGTATFANDEGARAFLWDRTNGMLSLGAFGFASYGADINSSGQVVGRFTDVELVNNSRDKAFIWDLNNGMQSIGTLGGNFSEAQAINDNGQIVGSSTTSFGYQKASLWDEINGISDLGALGHNASKAFDINDSGQIVGQTRINWSTQHRAAFWDASGSIQDLGALPGGYSEAYGINVSGQVVGYSVTDNGPNSGAAIVWDEVNGVRNLNDLVDLASGWNINTATAINNSGQIVGYGSLDGGDRQAVLLTPVAPVPVPVPLPAVAWLLLSGLVSLGWLKYRRSAAC